MQSLSIYDAQSLTYMFPLGWFLMGSRIAKELTTLVENLNTNYNSLSKKQAEYLSMETSDEKWGAQWVAINMIMCYAYPALSLSLSLLQEYS